MVVVSDASRPDGAPADPAPAAAGRRLARNLVLYTLARLVLVAVLAAVIVGLAHVLSVDIPLIVALLFALIIALPLSLVLFKRLRARVNEDIAAVDQKRRTDKAQLRARMRGDEG
nr:DUF4229 domain-containing protein [Nocardia transvalensis]